MSTTAEIAFAKWLQANDPYLFNVAVAVAKKQKSGNLGSFLTSIDWGSIGKAAVTTVKEIAPAVVQLQAQKKALDVNLKRAESGQAPINFNDYTPTIKVAADITPDAEAAINRSADTVINNVSARITKMLPFIAVGGVALFFLLRKRR